MCIAHGVEVFRTRIRKILIPALILAGILLCHCALADTARDITDDCKVTGTAGKFKINRVFDRQYKTYWTSEKEKNAYIQLVAPAGEKIYGVYVCFWDKLTDWQIQVLQDGKWTDHSFHYARYAHEYQELDGVDGVRICSDLSKKSTISVSEIFVFSQGERPEWVQVWQDTPETVDIMLLSAHPDDELLFFGGALPYYAGELKKKVLVAYMTCGTFERRSELLNGLWMCGVTIYPDIGEFWDKYSKKLDTAYEAWGKTKTYAYITELLRKYKPDVVLTHDINGEYGHGAHRVCADAMIKCVEYAQSSDKYPDTYALYGAWQVQKLYLHLAQQGGIEMDWDKPLSAFGGLTGFQVSGNAYREHVSQQTAGQKNPATGKYEYFVVEPRESAYSCYRFGLVYSTVGEDLNGNDFLENIPSGSNE